MKRNINHDKRKNFDLHLLKSRNALAGVGQVDHVLKLMQLLEIERD